MFQDFVNYCCLFRLQFLANVATMKLNLVKEGYSKSKIVMSLVILITVTSTSSVIRTYRSALPQVHGTTLATDTPPMDQEENRSLEMVATLTPFPLTKDTTRIRSNLVIARVAIRTAMEMTCEELRDQLLMPAQK